MATGRTSSLRLTALWLGAALFVFGVGARAFGAESAAPLVASLITVTTNYYTVTGATVAQVLASKSQARPKKDGVAYDAFTDWRIEWTYRYRRAGEAVSLGRIEIRTRVTVHLPRWAPPTEAESNLVTRWQRFLHGLGTHEQGHIDLARLATAEMQKHMTVTKDYSSAADLKAALERTSEEVIQKYRQKERTYDLETAHGLNQGARWR